MRERYINGIANTKHYRRECRHCKATFAHWFRSIKKANEAWNRRADAEPVVRGEWKTWEEQFPDRTTRKKNNLGVFCSACQLHADNMTSYCPNCGAKMESEGST